ncbi:MAG: undecaprenyl/decaprenyl-phosphate alpha-N-acetylglucosaminyl 1-phosphate transferase [Muribaculaceae bacterium]|nr:undecaprenyl/decaprenyl-phosphate alpha-N-acetylglucosaminyl 1-phosphate transferase [Muribaculaceae bacterium]
MDNWLLNNFLTFILAGVVVGGLIPQILIIAYRKRLFDSHDERKIHDGAVPRLGGIAFVPGIIFSVLLILGLGIKCNAHEIREVIMQGEVGLFFLFCSLMLLFLLGIADDLVEVRYRAKFIFQIIAGILTIVSGIWICNLHGFLGIGVIPDWIGWFLTVFAIVYIINALNLIDGIDGLAGSIAFLTLAYFGLAFYDADYYIYSMVAFGGAGGLLPFIYFNMYGSSKKNNKIFMGDTGSLTLGMVIAFLAVEFSNIREHGNIFADVNPITVAFSPLIIPILDQCRVFFHRILKRRNPFMPDRCHIHHKLLDVGLSDRKTLLVILLVDIGFVGLNWGLSVGDLNVNWIILIDFVLWTLGNMLLTKSIRKIEKKTGIILYD